MFIFGLSTLSLVSARSHLVFLSAEVTRDGQVDNYKSDAYDEISERLNGESLQATTTRQVQLPAEDWKRTLFQEIERSMAELGKQIIDYCVHLKQFQEYNGELFVIEQRIDRSHFCTWHIYDPKCRVRLNGYAAEHYIVQSIVFLANTQVAVPELKFF